jgi:hypothetical protein
VTVSVPDPVAAPDVVAVVVVGVVALAGVEETGGAAPAAPELVVFELWAQPASAAANAIVTASRPIIGAAPRSAGIVHE